MSLDDLEPMATLQEAFETIRAIPSSMHEHMDYIYQCASQSFSILEMGVNQGTSCVSLLAGLKPGGEMVSVDIQGPLTPIRFILEWCAGDVRDRNWMFMQSRSISAMRRLHESGWEFDLIFLDTSHTYDDTVEELVLCERLVAPGGRILMHDTVSFPEVKKAMEEFLERTQWQHENRENCHGLATLYAPAA